MKLLVLETQQARIFGGQLLVGRAGRSARAVAGLVARMIGETFPWGTIIINVTGCFVIGLFVTLTGPDGRYFVGSTARQFVMTGVCGGYTTFSAFSLQAQNLMNDGEWARGLCLIAVWAGYVLGSAVNWMEWA